MVIIALPVLNPFIVKVYLYPFSTATLFIELTSAVSDITTLSTVISSSFIPYSSFVHVNSIVVGCPIVICVNVPNVQTGLTIESHSAVIGSIILSYAEYN